jgi:EamA-like transporter family
LTIEHGRITSRIIMAGAPSQHRLGIGLVVAAAVAWSTAPFFTRLLPFDSWTILFWRGLFGGGLIAAILVLTKGRASLQDLAGMGSSGWLVASLSTLGMVTFIPALQLTSVSNVAVIIATGPLWPLRSLGSGFAKRPDGRPCWRAGLLCAASPSLSAARTPVPTFSGSHWLAS